MENKFDREKYEGLRMMMELTHRAFLNLIKDNVEEYNELSDLVEKYSYTMLDKASSILKPIIPIKPYFCDIISDAEELYKDTIIESMRTVRINKPFFIMTMMSDRANGICSLYFNICSMVVYGCSHPATYYDTTSEIITNTHILSNKLIDVLKESIDWIHEEFNIPKDVVERKLLEDTTAYDIEKEWQHNSYNDYILEFLTSFISSAELPNTNKVAEYVKTIRQIKDVVFDKDSIITFYNADTNETSFLKGRRSALNKEDFCKLTEKYFPCDTYCVECEVTMKFNKKKKMLTYQVSNIRRIPYTTFSKYGR